MQEVNSGWTRENRGGVMDKGAFTIVFRVALFKGEA